MNARSHRPPHRRIGLQQVGEGLAECPTNHALKSLPVERGKLRLDLWIINQYESPPFFDGGRVNGSIEDAGLHIVGDRVRFQPPHRAGRVQRFVDVHGSLLANLSLLCRFQSNHMYQVVMCHIVPP